MKIKNKKYISSLLISLTTIGSFTGCSNAENTSEVSNTLSTPLAGITVEYKDEDIDSTWDSSTASQITLNGDSINISGSGASTDGSDVTITDEGTYVISGTLTNGQIIVDAEKTDTVHLVLNGTNLTCLDNAVIYSKQSNKTILTLAKDTINTVKDATEYKYAEGEDEPDAAIFSKDDLTLNGSGSLTVFANFKHGIASKDDLIITGGNFNITSVKDGLRGRDSVAIKDGNFVIQAQGDGIQSNNDEDVKKGWISLDGGDFNITSGNDGIQAETLLQVADGKVNIKTGGGSANASTDDKGDVRPERDKFGSKKPETTVESTENKVSTKGLKAGTGILINGGLISIDSLDDSIHSNGDVLINKGELSISSGDDGIHADSKLTIKNGSINISKSYEGLEAESITINNGTINLNAKDDGLNAAGGNDDSLLSGNPRENEFAANQSSFIRITGGKISVNADGDGIDSNGNIYFDGGNIVANGPTNNGNGVLDYNGTCEITGGTLAVAGSSGMAQTPADSSSQNSLAVYYSSTQKAGTKVSLADEKGNSIYSFTPSKEYQFVVISTPDLKKGKTYTLLSGTTKLTDVTLSDVVTSISEDGSKVSGGMRGGMNKPPRDGENGRKMPPDGSNMPQDKLTQPDNN